MTRPRPLPPRRGAALALACVGTLGLSSCSGGGPLALLTGGGPNVAANVQAGKTNSQTIGQTRIDAPQMVRPQARRIEQSTGDQRLRAETVRQVTIQGETPAWLWLLALAGWLLPTPQSLAARAWGALRGLGGGRA